MFSLLGRTSGSTKAAKSAKGIKKQPLEISGEIACFIFVLKHKVQNQSAYNNNNNNNNLYKSTVISQQLS